MRRSPKRGSLACGLYQVKPEPNGPDGGTQGTGRPNPNHFSYRMPFHLSATSPDREPGIATHLYRIAQEAVANAIKHGKLSHIAIGLTETTSRMVVAVRDDGTGLPRRRKPKGMGLRIMQHRAGSIGASLVVQKIPDGGTSVVCSVHKLNNDFPSDSAAASERTD